MKPSLFLFVFIRVHLWPSTLSLRSGRGRHSPFVNRECKIGTWAATASPCVGAHRVWRAASKRRLQRGHQQRHLGVRAFVTNHQNQTDHENQRKCRKGADHDRVWGLSRCKKFRRDDDRAPRCAAEYVYVVSQPAEMSSSRCGRCESEAYPNSPRGIRRVEQNFDDLLLSLKNPCENH